jgi:hypothetical protein
MADYYMERYYADDFNSMIRYKDLTLRIHDYVLTLQLRIYIKQMHPPNGKTSFIARDADGNAALAQAWGYTEFYDYCETFKKQCYATWNDAFVLIPPAHYSGFVDPDTGVPRNVRCHLQIDLVERGGKGIHTIEAYRLVNNGQNLRANAGLLTSNDAGTRASSTKHCQPIDYRKDRNGKVRVTGGNPEGLTYYWNYQVFPHELGHLLGLDHIAEDGAACKKAGPNTRGCYGVYLQDAINVMGRGGALDRRNAEPWKKRIVKHALGTQTTQWRVEFASLEAQTKGYWSLTAMKWEA